MLSEKERTLLKFIISEMEEKGYPPTIREMMEVINVKSLRGVTYHLDELQKKSYIHRERLSRSITILPRTLSLSDEIATSKKSNEITIPIIGKVAAGNPIFVEEEFTDNISVPASLARNSKEYYALRVSGDSMVGDHILNRDIVVIRKQNFASVGEIVVAVINDSATLKRYFKENGYYRLQPSNPDYEPIITRELVINGVMVGLIRNFIN
jgi:repressor LexA